jgi:hypothetical protein
MPEPLIGSCHCGRLTFRVQRRPDRAIRCNCSYCSRRGWHTGYARPDEFELMQGADELSSYRFGSGSAEHFFCRRCGIHTHFYSRYGDEVQYGYNIACCEDIDVMSLPVEWIDGRSF